MTPQLEALLSERRQLVERHRDIWTNSTVENHDTFFASYDPLNDKVHELLEQRDLQEVSFDTTQQKQMATALLEEIGGEIYEVPGVQIPKAQRFRTSYIVPIWAVNVLVGGRDDDFETKLGYLRKRMDPAYRARLQESVGASLRVEGTLAFDPANNALRNPKVPLLLVDVFPQHRRWKELEKYNLPIVGASGVWKFHDRNRASGSRALHTGFADNQIPLLAREVCICFVHDINDPKVHRPVSTAAKALDAMLTRAGAKVSIQPTDVGVESWCHYHLAQLPAPAKPKPLPTPPPPSRLSPAAARLLDALFFQLGADGVPVATIQIINNKGELYTVTP
jgi:hypothetical protein